MRNHSYPWRWLGRYRHIVVLIIVAPWGKEARMATHDFPYQFLVVRADEVVALANGTTVVMSHGGVAVVFADVVLGPFPSRHRAESEASYYALTLLFARGATMSALHPPIHVAHSDV